MMLSFYRNMDVHRKKKRKIDVAGRTIAGGEVFLFLADMYMKGHRLTCSMYCTLLIL